jgi:hypothetical protein
MGNGTYSVDSRVLRATTMNYASNDISTVFTQQKSRVCHESMSPNGVAFRECRYSNDHPKALPIILALDVTGSMQDIPVQLIRSGLPTLMSTLIQQGVPDAALLFLAIGDHEADAYPIQIAQFESADAELDMWLTRTYLEGGGGGNAGESYPLAWEFAANRVKSDAWEIDKQKGFLFTIGDEPFLKVIPKRELEMLYGSNLAYAESAQTAEELYKAACEKFNVFHISVHHGYRNFTDPSWKQLMGQHLLTVTDHNEIPKLIANTVITNIPAREIEMTSTSNEVVKSEEAVML